MSLALVTLVTGIAGVFIVMTFLLITVSLSSKLAIYLEQRQKSADEN